MEKLGQNAVSITGNNFPHTGSIELWGGMVTLEVVIKSSNYNLLVKILLVSGKKKKVKKTSTFFLE